MLSSFATCDFADRSKADDHNCLHLSDHLPSGTDLQKYSGRHELEPTTEEAGLLCTPKA